MIEVTLTREAYVVLRRILDDLRTSSMSQSEHFWLCQLTSHLEQQVSRCERLYDFLKLRLRIDEYVVISIATRCLDAKLSGLDDGLTILYIELIVNNDLYEVFAW